MASSAANSPRGLPKSTLWLESYSYIITGNIWTIPSGYYFCISSFKVRFLEENFALYLVRLDLVYIAAYCCRLHPNPDAEPDDGYFLQIDFSIIGFSEETTKTAEMHCGEGFACAIFSLESFHRPFCQLKYRSYLFDLKVVIKMIELENLQSGRRERRENVLRLVREGYFTKDVMKDLGFLLQRPGVVDVFTGRLNTKCATLKMLTILRASKYSRRIATYITIIGSGIAKDIEFSQMLNYLLNGNWDAISDEDAIVAYLVSHGMGLDFYTKLVTDYLMSRLDDKDFVLEVIQAANYTEDKDLFKEAVYYFLKYYPDIKHSAKFKEICDNAG